MNFYASHEYLESIAEVCFKRRRWTIEDVRIDDQVLRLLVIDNNRLVTNGLFLDYHIPLDDSEARTVVSRSGYAKSVAHRIIEVSEWKDGAFKGFDLAPFVDWSRFSTYDDYKAFILGRNRGLVRERERRRRRFTETFGEPVFRMDDDQDDVLQLSRQWKSRQLLATGLKNWIIDPQVTEFLAVLRRKGLLTSSTLRISGRLAAVWIGFVYEGCWSGWIFTHDPELGKYSVGHHLVSAMIEESHKLQHREFDFSSGAEDYKMIYATHARLLGAVGRPTLSERLIARAKEKVKERNPKLFQMAQDLKKEVNRKKGRHAFWPLKYG
jgi:hypothetical protein